MIGYPESLRPVLHNETKIAILLGMTAKEAAKDRSVQITVAVIAAMAIILAAVLPVLLNRGSANNAVSPGLPSPSTTTSSTLSFANCTFNANTDGIVIPSPRLAGDLVFCPVQVNRGHLPITGPFWLQSDILGPATERAHLLLAVSPDPSTCDAFGKRPTGSTFVLDQANLKSSDGEWSFFDSLGNYRAGVTLGRTYVYIRAPELTLADMRQDHAKWNAEGHDPGDYPGILTLPNEAEIVAKFAVPGGQYDGKIVPCKS